MVGGSYCRLQMPLTRVLREAASGQWLGAREGEGGRVPPSNASLHAGYQTKNNQPHILVFQIRSLLPPSVHISIRTLLVILVAYH